MPIACWNEIRGIFEFHIGLDCRFAHHSRHIPRYAASTFRANRRAFISGDDNIFCRSDCRSSCNLAPACESAIAVCTYCRGRRAISSANPILERMLCPPRPTAVFPESVTTGTPIHRESSVVVWPEKGNGSRVISMRSYCFRYVQNVD